MTQADKAQTDGTRGDGPKTACHPPDFLKPVCGIYVVKRKITAVFTAVISYLVDPKGIEPSNLTDANRALSQLSYGPKFELFQIELTDFHFEMLIS